MPSPKFSSPWQVKYTRRQGSIALQISTGLVKVLAPQGTPARAIHALLEQRRSWIEQALLQQQQTKSKTANRSYEAGEYWLFQGDRHRLEFASDSALVADPNNLTVERDPDRLTLRLPLNTEQAQRRALLQHWYLQQAHQQWPERLEYWANITELQPSGLKIRTYKSRWGSCNSRGLISLNSLLLMAPLETLDYVIIHELCHLRHPNHGAAFWQLVERYCPAPKQHRRWLRQHISELRF